MFVHFENSELHVVICSIKLVQPLQSYDHLMSLEFLLEEAEEEATPKNDNSVRLKLLFQAAQRIAKNLPFWICYYIYKV